MTTTTTRRRLGVTLLAALAIALAGGGAAGQETSAEPERETKTIKMVAENWKFVPDTIRVTKGTRVVLQFQSWDASHSFVLKAYRIKHPLPQDSTSEIEFVADKVGEFPYKCGRPCGDGCPKMRGTLIVAEE